MQTEQKTPNQLTENVKLLQKVVVLYQGKVLILRRSEDQFSRPNLWDLPGGNAEWLKNAKEDVRDPHADDAVREVKEETGLIINKNEINKPVYVGTYFQPDINNYSIILGWKVEVLGDLPTIQLSSEHSEYAWVTLEECDSYNFGFAWDNNGFIKEMVTVAFNKSA